MLMSQVSSLVFKVVCLFAGAIKTLLTWRLYDMFMPGILRALCTLWTQQDNCSCSISRMSFLSRGFHWLMQWTDGQTIILTERLRKKNTDACKQLYLKRHSWNIHAACWETEQQQQQQNSPDRTMAKENAGTQFVAHKLLQLLLLCRVNENAVDPRHTLVTSP